VLKALRETVMDDIGRLVGLHEQALDGAAVERLKAARFPHDLGLCLRSDTGRSALAMVEGAVAGLSSDGARLAMLGADHAAVYQGAGGALVARLQTVGGLIGGGQAALFEAADHLDSALLDATEGFTPWVAARARDPFYPALALLTAAYARELRELLYQAVEEPRSLSKARCVPQMAYS